MKPRNEKARESHAARLHAAAMKHNEEDMHPFSMSSSGIFRDEVSSVYDRLQAREELEQLQSKQQAFRTPSTENTQQLREESDVWTKTMAERLSYPSVSLPLLERMQLVFISYDCYCQRKRRGVLCSADERARETDMMDKMGAMISSREQELEVRERLRRGGGHSREANSAAPVSHSMTAGIPFSVFEKFIVEPYFDALFPPIQKGRQTMESFMDTLDTCRCSSAGATKLSWGLSGRLQKQTHVSYQRRRASHVEAAENLFSLMDTNGDGFLSWDEFSGYILQSGQRALLNGEYNRGDGTKEGKAGDAKGARKLSHNAVNVASRYLNFTTTPLNVNPWQQQCPLVRHLFHSEPISRLLFANRGRRYVTAAWDGLVKVWRPNPRLADAYGRPSIVHERTIFTAGAPIVDMVLAPASLGDAEILAVVCMDGTVTLLSVATGEVLKTFIGRWSLPPNEGLGQTISTPTRSEREESHTRNAINLPLVEKDIRNTVEGSAVVLRPVFKVRAYRREAIEIFFTEVSRYFIGLDVVAPTYEHLERRRVVKTDVLLNFGDEPETSMRTPPRQRFLATSPSNNDAGDTKEVTNSTGCGTVYEAATALRDDPDDKSAVENSTASVSEYPQQHKKQQRQRPVRSVHAPASAASPLVFHQRSARHDNASNKCWFARSVAFARYERTNSASILPSGVFLLLGFETGVLQFYQLRPQLFTISNLSLTRLEVPTMHEPILTLKLHCKTITSILSSEVNDLLVTASDDGTVVVRHMSRVQVPYVTLGDGLPPPNRPPPVHPGGHTKRITCICWHGTRNLIVTGGADRIIIFWTPSSSRPLHRIDLRTFSTSSGTSGTPIDASFLEPPRHPLSVLILDTRRMLYFIDTVSYQCLHILRDDGLSSLKAGDMLRARYDAVDNRLILGGRHVRSWDIHQRDEYPDDYCGHRRPVIGLAYQHIWSFWVSADDAVVIIWDTKVLDLRLGRGNSTEQEMEEGNVSTCERRSTIQLARKGCRWSAQTRMVRSWCVDGGICCLAVDQSESSHVFVALLRERHILEYNSFNGSVLRSFDFPAGMVDISSLACGVATGGAAFLRPMSFLCGTFEREQSPNGTTALYAMTLGSDVISAVQSTGGVHRSIVTAGVGVSCAIIVAALGLVVVGHRGGISVTPVAEATTCPIACLRLTDAPTRGKPNTKEEKRAEPVVASDQHRSSGPHPGAAAASVVSPPTATATGMNRSQRRSLVYHNMQSEEKTHCRPSPPLDLVALLPGPLLHDPVDLTRECMQQRERYLFYNEQPNSALTGNHLESRTETTITSFENEDDEKRSSKDANLPPLLLFSDEFIAASPVFTGTFGVLLREQLSALGYVGHLVPIIETGYVVSGSDDGVVQFWNLHTLSEVMRYRVTYTLEAVTALEVSNDAFNLAVGDANGYVLLLDMHRVAWDSLVPLEMVSGIEGDVRVLQRWRGHRQSTTSVRFVRRVGGMIHRSTVHSQTAEQSLPRTGSSFPQSPECDISAAKDSCTVEDKSDGKDSKHEIIFLCTSGEDSYIYAWCWEAGLSIGGSVHCIGCFGGGVEAPPMPPVDKLTDSAWQVLELVRKAYIKERLMSSGGVFSGPNTQAEIHTAVLELMEDMRALKAGAALPQREAAAVKRQSHFLPGLLRGRDCGRGPHLDSIHRAAKNCPPTYVLAFEDGLYYDRGIVELLERVLTELRSIYKRRQSIMKAASCRTSLVEARRSRNSLQTASSTPQEKNMAANESRPTLMLASTLDTTTAGGNTLTASATATFMGNGQTSSMPRSTATGMLSLTEAPLSVPHMLPAEASLKSECTKTGHEGGGASSSTEGPRVTRSGMDFSFFPMSATSTAAHSSTPHIFSSPEQYATNSTPSLTVVQREPPFFRLNDEDCLAPPSVTVCFATPTPLPRLHCTGKTASEGRMSRTMTGDGLPAISDIIGINKTKGDDRKQRQYGVKVLLRQRARRRSHHLVFVEKVKKKLALQETDNENTGNVEDRRAARRGRKRQSVAWEAARIMNTIMAWKVPRVLTRTPRTSTGNLEAELVKCPSPLDSVKVPNFKLPMFIPLTLGVSHAVTSIGSLQLDQSKSIGMVLKEEMMAMKATLQSALHEKQMLMAQERAAAAGSTASTQIYFSGR